MIMSKQNELVVTRELSNFFFFERINLKAKHEFSCFIACHLGEIEALHKLMEPH